MKVKKKGKQRHKLDAVFQQAQTLHQANEIIQAQILYKQILKKSATHAPTLHFLGLSYYQQGKHDKALKYMKQALAQEQEVDLYYGNLGLVQTALGQISSAKKTYKKAIQLNPRYAHAYNNLANLEKQDGDHASAKQHYQLAIQYMPDFIDAYNNLGLLSLESNDLNLAHQCFSKAIEINPNNPQSYTFIGTVYSKRNDYVTAEQMHQKALALSPHFITALNHLGLVYLAQNQFDAARTCFNKALTCDPSQLDALLNLGQSWECQQQHSLALQIYLNAYNEHRHAIGLLKKLASCYFQLGQLQQSVYYSHKIIELTPDSIENWQAFAKLLRNYPDEIKDPAIEAALYRCLALESIDHTGLARLAAQAMLGKSALSELKEQVFRTAAADLSLTIYTLITPTLSHNTELQLLLRRAPVNDIQLEVLLTKIRYALLLSCTRQPRSNQSEVTDGILSFACALALQCFLNEYVYFETEQEIHIVATLQDEVSRITQVANLEQALQIVLLSCYRPLYQYFAKQPNTGDSTTLASNPDWQRLVTIQLQQPTEERQLQQQIKVLSSIDNEVSQAVQRQYEQNPYPRWNQLTYITPQPYQDLMYQYYPYLKTRSYPLAAQPEILIAGCGTGRQALSSAASIANSKVLAIDLSRASLAYAMRKARDLGIDNIDFMQGDILQLSCIDQQFDLIESSGVLHHMQDPLLGWQQLIRLLKPGGLMNIGLYSEIARQGVVACRSQIAQMHYASTPQGIRNFRQEVLTMDAANPMKSVLNFKDFYTLSDCRDLLFHVQEHRFTLLQLAAIFAELNLTFLCFKPPRSGVMQAYQQQFPDDPWGTNVHQWHTFETQHPTTFSGMYQFLVTQKTT